jgi:hypothetical protein
MQLRNLGYLCLAATLACAPKAFADNVNYADWTSNTGSTVMGSIGSVNVTYSGEISFVQLSNMSNFNYFQPTTTYTSGTVSNAPTDGALIAIDGNGTTDTFTFSTAVTGLIFSEVSMGQPGIGTTYTFDQPFTVLSCGPNSTYGGGCFDQAVGTTSFVLSGNESDGTIEFLGPITTLSFTTSNPEHWNGFDIGLLPQSTSPTPEPSSLILLGTGLLSAAGVLRKRLVRK